MAEEPLTREALGEAISGLSDSDVDRVAAEQGTTNLVARALATTAARPGHAPVEDGAVEWEIATADGPAAWHLVVSGGTVEPVAGRDPSPRVSLSGSLADFLRVTAGLLDLRQAMLDERVRVAGDLVFAARLYASDES